MKEESAIVYSFSYSRRPVKTYRRKSYRRHGRSIEDETQTFEENETLSNAILDISLNDAEDCVKKLICSLNAQDTNTLEADEQILADVFGKTAEIDLTCKLRYSY